MPYARVGTPILPPQDVRHEQFPDEPARTMPFKPKSQNRRVRAIVLKPRKSHYKPVKESSRYLSTEQKLSVLARLAAGESGASIAKDLGRSKASIYQIKNGHTNIGGRQQPFREE